MGTDKQNKTHIDGLFGSKTRVKLLHLFLNNPGASFYVREITRIVDEQINSVRRELANLLQVGVIKSNTADNKLYYEVDQRYEYFQPFREIFGDKKRVTSNKEVYRASGKPEQRPIKRWQQLLSELHGVRFALISGILVEDSLSSVDIFVAGAINATQLSKIIKIIEQEEGRDINFASMSYDEFYYRLSVKDRFISELLTNKHQVIVDIEKIVV
jgi:predicted transcriptional regulator